MQSLINVYFDFLVTVLILHLMVKSMGEENWWKLLLHKSTFLPSIIFQEKYLYYVKVLNFYKDWEPRLKLFCIQIAKCLTLPIYFIGLLYVPNSLVGHLLCWCTTIRDSYKMSHPFETGKIWNLKWCHRKGSSGAFNYPFPLQARICFQIDHL